MIRVDAMRDFAVAITDQVRPWGLGPQIFGVIDDDAGGHHITRLPALDPYIARAVAHPVPGGSLLGDVTAMIITDRVDSGWEMPRAARCHALLLITEGATIVFDGPQDGARIDTRGVIAVDTHDRAFLYIRWPEQVCTAPFWGWDRMDANGDETQVPAWGFDIEPDAAESVITHPVISVSHHQMSLLLEILRAPRAALVGAYQAGVFETQTRPSGNGASGQMN